MLQSHKQSRSGHASTWLVLVKATTIVFGVLFAMLSVRDGIHNGSTILQLLGTAVINFGIGLCFGVCLVLSIIVLFFLVAVLLIGLDFLCSRWRRK